MSGNSKKSSAKIKKDQAAKKAQSSVDKPSSVFSLMDKYFQANLAKVTGGLSPAAIKTSYFSWFAQLAQSPGTLARLSSYPMRHMDELVDNLSTQKKPRDGKDVRFNSDNWSDYPWRLWAEQFLQFEDWCLQATKVPGLPVQVKRSVAFGLKQMVDALSPSNFVLTNPDLFQETIHSKGENLVRGSELAMQDFIEKISGAAPQGVENFIPGKHVAITKGRVVFKNHLIELIQYEAQTKKVYKEPVLMLPAWIMKYYILDLLPENSLINWLTQQGHTVFIVSWLNPDSEDRNLSLDDYFRLGAMAAIDTVSNLCPKAKIHLLGYCLGGTLAMIAAAFMAQNNDNRLKSLTLLAAQGDFTEAGELLLFITKSEISFLKNMMWEQGYLDTKQMAGSFQMLRSYDLIWSKMVQDYMHGKQRGMIALLAWNADATRMPYKMHSQYLEQLFLNNDFSQGRYAVEGQYIVPKNIQVPAFVVSTEKDHVAPWKSVYKTHLLLNSDITFVLTSGGHNAGIVSEPGRENRSYRISERSKNEAYVDPKTWLETTPQSQGSWWVAWQEWLVSQSTAVKINPPKLDAELAPAPGRYVLKK